MDANYLRQQKRQEEMKPFLDTMAAATVSLGIRGPEEKLDHETPIGTLRRRRRPHVADDNVGMIALTEVDGVLEWEEGAGARTAVGRRSRRGGGPILTGEIIAQYKLQPWSFNKIFTAYDHNNPKRADIAKVLGMKAATQ